MGDIHYVIYHNGLCKTKANWIMSACRENIQAYPWRPNEKVQTPTCTPGDGTVKYRQFCWAPSINSCHWAVSAAASVLQPAIHHTSTSPCPSPLVLQREPRGGTAMCVTASRCSGLWRLESLGSHHPIGKAVSRNCLIITLWFQFSLAWPAILTFLDLYKALPAGAK